jgi:hypothetical protein
MQQPALLRDRIGKAHARAGQRVPPAGFGIAPQQDLVFRVQIEHLAAQALLFQVVEQFRDRSQIVGAVARIEAYREAPVDRLIGANGMRHQRLHQAGRDVVDAVPAEILEHVERDALARSGKPADDDEPVQAGRPRATSAA